MFLDNSGSYAQTQSGPLLFRRKKGLEDFLHDSLGNPGAVVAHLNDGDPSQRFGDPNFLAYYYMAAVTHRLTGIYDEVHEDFLQLLGVAIDLGKPALTDEFEADPVGFYPVVEQLDRHIDDIRGADALDFEFGGPRKFEEVPEDGIYVLYLLGNDIQVLLLGGERERVRSMVNNLILTEVRGFRIL